MKALESPLSMLASYLVNPRHKGLQHVVPPGRIDVSGPAKGTSANRWSEAHYRIGATQVMLSIVPTEFTLANHSSPATCLRLCISSSIKRAQLTTLLSTVQRIKPPYRDATEQTKDTRSALRLPCLDTHGRKPARFQHLECLTYNHGSQWQPIASR